MRFLPIVERELRVAARRWGTFWLRTWVAMIVIGVSAWIVLVNLNERPSDVSGYLFYTITAGGMLYCLLIGLSATADSLSEEKREGTLGLLFLTNLRGFDVVAGKLAANSLNCCYGLLAIIPVMGLPLLLGGITAGQYGSAAVALVNAMFFSLSSGMFASACCRSRRKAVLLTFGIIMLFAALLPGLAMWTDRSGTLPLRSWRCLCSPITALFAPLDFGLWVKDWHVFASSVATVNLLAWLFLLMACAVARRSWQDRPEGVMKSRGREWWRWWSLGDVEERRRFRRRLLDRNAFFWLAARERLKPMWTWMLLGLAAGFWIWGYTKLHRDWLNTAVYILTAFVLNLTLKCWFAAESVKSIAAERHSGTLELLLVTDLTPREIVSGQGMALRRQFLWPLVLLLIAELAMLVAGGRNEIIDVEQRRAWLLWWASVLSGLIADLFALYWMGMWLGLAARSSKKAYTTTVAAVLMLPSVCFMLILMLVFALSASGRLRGEPGGTLLLGFWLVLNLGVSLFFAGWARRRLMADFRELAARRFEPGRPWWKNVFALSPLPEVRQATTRQRGLPEQP